MSHTPMRSFSFLSFTKRWFRVTAKVILWQGGRVHVEGLGSHP